MSKELILGDKPFIHPGNLSGWDLAQWVEDLSRKMHDVMFEKGKSDKARDAAPIARRKFEDAMAALLEVGGPQLQEATLPPESQAEAACASDPKLDLLKAKLAVDEQELRDRELAKPVIDIRVPTPAEIETLQAVLSGSLAELWVESSETLTTTAIVIAGSVRAAFEEIYRSSTANDSLDFSS